MQQGIEDQGHAEEKYVLVLWRNQKRNINIQTKHMAREGDGEQAAFSPICSSDQLSGILD